MGEMLTDSHNYPGVVSRGYSYLLSKSPTDQLWL